MVSRQEVQNGRLNINFTKRFSNTKIRCVSGAWPRTIILYEMEEYAY